MSPTDNLEEKTREALDQVPIGALPSVDGIVKRAQVLRRRRYGSYFLSAVTLVALAASGFMFAQDIDPPQRAEVAGPSDATSPTPLSQPGDLDGDCPPEGPATDPDCPGVQWVREVLHRAGFAITGDTGSALVGRGERSTFFMHAFEDKSEAVPANLRLQETIGGIDVYGDGRIRLMWRVQRLAVWLEYGPSSEALLPKGKELRALVISSDSVEYDAAP